MKLKSINELRKRVHIDCSSPKITSEKYARESDINNIMKKYQTTGLLPQSRAVARYSDNTNIPSLEEAFDITQKAYDDFYKFPAQLRKMMDNDPRNLEKFISDKSNEDLLKKFGIITTADVITEGNGTAQAASGKPDEPAGSEPSAPKTK